VSPPDLPPDETTMSFVLLLTVAGAVAPAVFLLHYVYARDKYEREPLALIVRVYLVSFLTVIPAVVLEAAGIAVLQGLGAQAVIAAGLMAFAVVGTIEEGSKFLFLRWLAFRRPEFNEPYDGIMYAVSVGLGFATVENVGYVFSAPDLLGRVGLIVIRALLAVPAHALMGVIMGYYVGRAKFVPHAPERRRLLWLGFLWPVFAHGVYDFPLLVLVSEPAPGVALAALVAVPVVIGALWVVGVRLIHRAQALSPFKRPSPLVNPLAAVSRAYRFCAQCGARAQSTDAFCAVCGTHLRPPLR
jgi:RsiW-degrading membrane proteinase PrsW (M82 family)